MARIATFIAPEKTIRPSATGTAALELAGRRINPLYQSVAQNARAQGQLQAQQYKEMLWPLDILKLYDDRARQQSSGGIRVKIGGGGGSHAGHGQVSRGIGALGGALGDGGYSLSKPAAANGGYPAEEDISGGPVQSVDYTQVYKDQALAAKNTETNDSIATNAAYAAQSYWQKLGYSGIPTTPVSSFNDQGQVTVDPYSTGYDTGVVASAAIPAASDTSGYWSGLSDYVQGTNSGVAATAAIPAASDTAP